MRIDFLQIATLILLAANMSSPVLAKAYSALSSVQSAGTENAMTTAALMQAIKEHDLSPEAQNITVLNLNGATVLRGVVKDDREKMTIGSLASQCGCTNIKNELVVKSAKTTPVRAKRPLVIYRKTH